MLICVTTTFAIFSKRTIFVFLLLHRRRQYFRVCWPPQKFQVLINYELKLS